jgi:hypothetical protein
MSEGAFAQMTAFTYQGFLNSGGVPANGCYDMTVTLFATNTGGQAMAGPVTNLAVVVSNGLFVTTVDIGAGVFNGSNYWLDIAVRTNGGDDFTDLTPRQAITAAPYAILAGFASNLLGTIPLSQLPKSVVINNETGVAISGSFTGNGAGLTNLNVTNLAGTLPALNATNLTNLPASAFGSMPANSLLGNGTSSSAVPAASTNGDFLANSIVPVIYGSATLESANPNIGNSSSPLLITGGNSNLAVAANSGMNPQLNMTTLAYAGSGIGINLLWGVPCNLTNNGAYYNVFTNYTGGVSTNLITPLITNLNGVIVGYVGENGASINFNGPNGQPADSPQALELIGNGYTLTKISTVLNVTTTGYTNGQKITNSDGNVFTYANGIPGNYSFLIADPVGWNLHPHVYLGQLLTAGAFNNHSTNFNGAIDVDLLTGLTIISNGLIVAGGNWQMNDAGYLTAPSPQAGIYMPSANAYFTNLTINARSSDAVDTTLIDFPNTASGGASSYNIGFGSGYWRSLFIGDQRGHIAAFDETGVQSTYGYGSQAAGSAGVNPTGITNNNTLFGGTLNPNCKEFLTGTNLTYTNYNSTGAAYLTNTVTGANVFVDILQAGGCTRTSNGLSGMLVPF